MFKDFWRNWKEEETPFKWEVNTYYSYLPAAFIHHDLLLNYEEAQKRNYLFELAPNGNKVIKYTCGMSVMYMPWFFIGHKIATNTHVPQDGYSGPYGDMVHYGTLFYSLLALLFLRSVLLRYFKDLTVAITLLCLFFGTNLFFYTVTDGMMTHGYLFFLFSALFWLIIRWHETFKYKYAIWIGFTIGLATLIRPTELISGLVFLFYGVYSIATLKEKMHLLLGKWKHLLLMLLMFLVAVSPQLIYWKIVSGHLLFDSYGHEGFFFGDPVFGKILFSWRKGWLLYTPIMAFALIGIFLGKKYVPKLQVGIIIYFLVNLYVVASWWNWWYAGSFGMRALVQSYCFLAVFLAAFIEWASSFKIRYKLPEALIKYGFACMGLFLISLNLIQNYEFNKGMIHPEAMTRKAYKNSFMKFEYTGRDVGNYWNTLKAPDYGKALSGDRKEW
jgi:hypothetical protein